MKNKDIFTAPVTGWYALTNGNIKLVKAKWYNWIKYYWYKLIHIRRRRWLL